MKTKTDLLPRVRRAARNVAMKMLFDKHRGFIDDVVAHTMSSFMKTFDDALLPRKPEAWASEVARNKAKSILRHENRMAEFIAFTDDMTEAESVGIFEPVLSPSELLDSQERMDAVVRVIRIINDSVSEMCPEDQEIYERVFRRKLPLNQIADELSQKPNTIAKRWGRMLQSLAARSLDAVRKDSLCAEVFSSLLLSTEKWGPSVIRLLRVAVSNSVNLLDE